MPARFHARFNKAGVVTGFTGMILVVLLSSGHAAHGHDIGTESHADEHSHQSVAAGHVTIGIEGDFRVIESDGLPNHKTGQFPGPRNPNRISAQSHRFRVPVAPKVAEKTTPLQMHPFGVAINGVPLDPGAAEFWNRDRRSGWQYEALGGVVDLGLDQSNGHVQPTGAYHYHGTPRLLLETLSKETEKPEMLLIGYAADGFPIYNDQGHSDAGDLKSPMKQLVSSYRVRKGQRTSGEAGPGGTYDGRFVQDWEYVAGAGDLDECNGRIGVTPEYPEGIYHYVVTQQFPYIPRLFRGTPDESFMRHGPPPGGGFPGGPPRGGRGGRRSPPPPPFFPPPRR
ncbi:YHYH protein [Stieleria varia]|uniref:YHYH domain-containing protein n=1 Tax=Stieleria varia TaxID=2528005 RepID=A0A5C6B9C8_9BACT|nr:YHYH protein [Stieleria varia]TWU08327.1 hypothetical protein Pla52n_09090 [Stieleria varia]